MLFFKGSFRVELLCLIFCWTFCELVAEDCDSKETCDQCIQELNCFWCTDAVTVTKSHCLPRTQDALMSCSNQSTEDPQHVFLVISNENLTENEQISPQKVKLKLRKNEKYEIKFSYKQSANYPVDLYYIMDLSHSMRYSKDNLSTLGKDLAAEMRRKTNNFMIGFGSFVDKLTLPFVNTHPEALKSPCDDCAPPYSFKNHLKLQPDAGLFSQKVNETRMSGNLDTPEGGLDAIMQAMVCKEEIGWRSNARHLLVMSTDAVSHIAGDGKLGGVIEPNDAQCHMEDDTYTKGLVYDYPSVSQINYVARENNMNIIFAIAHNSTDLKNHYKEMSKVIKNSKTGVLAGSSNNVVKFISDIYEQIRDSVKIASNASKDVSVNITSTCPEFKDGGCSSVKPGQTLEFTAIIEPRVCHKDPKLNQKIITIKPEGLGDSLIVDLEVSCDCGCAAKKEVAHKTCNNFGALECGICRCDQGRFGNTCECDRKQTINNNNTNASACIKPGTNNITCSGQGKCLCGKCVCNKRQDESEHIYGKHCECDDFSCPLNTLNTLKCSGHGQCVCGKCKCYGGWSGAACDCSQDNSQCFSPNDKKECSGNGKCVCGHCQCNTHDKERYTGTYCEICASCAVQRCDEFKPCVECQAYKSGIYANGTDCMDKCKSFNTTVVEKLGETAADGVKRCRLIVEKNCDILFEYSEENEVLVVTAGKEKICSMPVSLIAWVSGVIGSVLLIGILTLIAWKIFTTVHDKKEYASFLSEKNKTQWSTGENPLYKPGTSHFQNPAYMRASQRFSAMALKKQEPAPEENGSESK